MILDALVVGALLGILVGFGLGWSVNGAYRAHLDVRTTKRGLPGMRRHRWARIKATFKPLVYGGIALIILWALYTGGRQTAARTGPSPSPAHAR